MLDDSEGVSVPDVAQPSPGPKVELGNAIPKAFPSLSLRSVYTAARPDPKISLTAAVWPLLSAPQSVVAAGDHRASGRPSTMPGWDSG